MLDLFLLSAFPMAIAVKKEMQCTLERNIISVWADLVEPHPSINFYDSLKPAGLCDLSM